MKTETSPTSLRGLTHREVGDFTDELRRAHGDARAVHREVRRADDRAADARRAGTSSSRRPPTRGLLYTDYDIKTGASIDYRVARHLGGAAEVIRQMGAFFPEKEMSVELAVVRRRDGEGDRRVPARPVEGRPEALFRN